MTSPPPSLPPIRSLGIDLPESFFASDPIPTIDRPLPSEPILEHLNERHHSLPPVGLSRPDISMPPARAPPPQPAEIAIHENEVDEASYDEEDHRHHDDDDDDSEDEMERDYGEMDGYPWRPISEDTSEPCADELEFIESKEELSAANHAHWEKQTFFDLDDPELKPGATGRIEWIVNDFNGTKEKPNKQLVMKSPTVRIGDHDWQIKLYPTGNRTEFLSVYVENVTMSKPDFQYQVDFKQPPLPVLVGSPRSKRRVSLAAQISIIMYNPAEPRTYHFKADAHQFHKHSSDHGWKYFTSEPRYEFHIRKHTQRQAILRNDTLAFTAYIRLVQDPTGCMWDTPSHDHHMVADALPSPTTLGRLESPSARTATYLILLHFAPFRKWLYTTRATSPRVQTLQVILHKFLSRKMKRKYLKHHDLPGGCDVVAVLQALREALIKDDKPQIVHDFDVVMGSLSTAEMPVSYNRLQTSTSSSLSEALAKRPSSNAAPPFLAIELERQRFNATTRKWEKVSNAVTIDNKLVYGRVEYQLFAAVVPGKIGSTKYIPYIRPGGANGLWFAYEDNSTKCLTSKSVSDRFAGIEPTPKRSCEERPVVASKFDVKHKEEPNHVYLAIYARSDAPTSPFLAPAEETWHLSETLQNKVKRSFDTATSRGGHRPRHDAKPSPAAVVSQAPPGYDRNEALPDQQVDFMDGDDVIMSDAEDGPALQSYLNNTLGGRSEQMMQQRVHYFSGDCFNGTILHGKYHGKGHLISTNGDEFEGDFKYGKPNGEGTMIYGASGDQYTGGWLDGQHHGQGQFNEKKTGNVFTGGWQEGRQHGKFVLEGEVTEDDKQLCQICYSTEMNVAFYDCGHVVACKSCAASLHHCPVCRKSINAKLELFGVKISMQ